MNGEHWTVKLMNGEHWTVKLMNGEHWTVKLMNGEHWTVKLMNYNTKNALYFQFYATTCYSNFILFSTAKEMSSQLFSKV
jgi:hypothetical protein